MAYTEQDRDKLKKAIASGVRTIDSHSEGLITFRSLAEMEKTLAAIEAELAVVQDPLFVPTRRVVFTGRSGF